MRFTFKKTDRILKRSDFLALAKHGYRLQNDVFIVVLLPGKTGRSRLGITVTRKVGGAVKRNRIKRLVREFFRCSDFRRDGNWDVNVIAKKKAAESPPNTIFSALKSLFDQLAGHLERNEC